MTDVGKPAQRFGLGAIVLAVLAFAVIVGGSPFAHEVTATQWPFLAVFGFVAWSLLAAGGRDVRVGGLDAAAAALLVAGAASLLWTPDVVTGLVFLIKFAALWAVVVALRSTYRPAAMLVFAGALAAASAFGLATRFLVPDLGSYVGGFANPNFQAEYLLMAIPWMAAGFYAAGHWLLKSAFAAVLAAAFVHLAVGSDSKIVILVLAAVPSILLTGFAVRRRPRQLLWLVPVLVAIAGISYLRGVDEFVRSLSYRGEILFDSLSIWLDYPVFGAGAGSFNALYPLYQERHLAVLPDNYLIRRNYLVGSAHNEFLQFAVQFGLAGLSLAAFAVWSCCRDLRAAGAFGIWQWAALVSLLDGAVAALVGFPFQMPATLLLAVWSIAALGVSGGGAAGTLVLAPWARNSAVAVALSLLAGAGYGAVRGAAAQIDMRWSLLLREAGPDVAFDYHKRAAARAPWDGFVVPTLYLTRTFWQSRIDRTAGTVDASMFPLRQDPLAEGPDADRVWFERSLARMPNGPNLRLARLQYLLNLRRTVESRDEIESHFAFLARYGRTIPEAAILETYFGLLLRDRARAQESLDRLKLNRFARDVGANVALFELEIAKLRADPGQYAFIGIMHLTW